jgi:hypothetical protein
MLGAAAAAGAAAGAGTGTARNEGSKQSKRASRPAAGGVVVAKGATAEDVKASVGVIEADGSGAPPSPAPPSRARRVRSMGVRSSRGRPASGGLGQESGSSSAGAPASDAE